MLPLCYASPPANVLCALDRFTQAHLLQDPEKPTLQEKAVFFSETETSAQRPNPSNGGRPQFLKSRDKSEKVDEQKKSFATKKS